MKRSLVFILLLVNSSVFTLNACGFYPFGEEVRFCFMRPEQIGYSDYSYFNYSAHNNYYIDYSEMPNYMSEDPNITLWSAYCRGMVDSNAISDAIYNLKAEQISKKSTNKMVRYLFSKNDDEAIRYILFAKECENYSGMGDIWEKDEKAVAAQIDAMIKKAEGFAKAAKSKDIRDRYLFLAVRMSYYNGYTQNIKDIYSAFFKDRKYKNSIYYWVLYFRAITEKNPSLANYYVAQVFAHAPDKRIPVKSYYDREVAIEDVIAYARTKEEIANIWLINGLKTTDKGLMAMQQLYYNNPQAEGLGFLLLREINKLEDWILTPRYTLFLPSIRDDYWENINPQRILDRVEVDRKYAAQVLAFVNKTDLSEVDNPQFFKLAKCYLQFLTKGNASAIAGCRELKSELTKSDALYRQVFLIEGLAITASQQQGKAIVPQEIKNLLIEQYRQKNYRYIFAIGRELEDKGNTTDAALLYSVSKSDEELYYDYDGGRTPDHVNWKTQKRNVVGYSDFVDNYLDYIDGYYTTAQLEQLISNVDDHKSTTPFESWLYHNAKKDTYDLKERLGVKYVRENKLPEALASFKKLRGYKENYTFENDPFYIIKYTPEFKVHNKRKAVTREYIVAKLIKVLQQAENANNRDRDYYYFLAADCYYNMSFYGNAWEMRRFFVSGNEFDARVGDDDEFYGCFMAEKYYSLAFKYAKTEKFKALCIRMMGKCVENRHSHEKQRGLYNDDYVEDTSPNPFYDDLKKNYPGQYNDMVNSNCTAFADYFKARR